MKRLVIIGMILLVNLVGLVSCTAPVQGISPTYTSTQTIVETQVSPAPASQINSPDRSATETQTSTYKDAGYIIDGEYLTLQNGESVIEAEPGSSTKIDTRYFGYESFGDLNGDGQEDVVFVLTQNKGGSGTFYYVVAAFKTEDGYQGTNGVLLGDRIAPQTTTIENGVVKVIFADRKLDEPFTTAPSILVTKYLKLVGDNLVEFEP